MNPFRMWRFWRKQKKASWESLCKKCGICCYEKESKFLHMEIDTSRPCEYLDLATMQCKVYDRRFRENRFCGKVTFFHACFSRALPETCGYVERYRKNKLFPTARFSHPSS